MRKPLRLLIGLLLLLVIFLLFFQMGEIQSYIMRKQRPPDHIPVPEGVKCKSCHDT